MKPTHSCPGPYSKALGKKPFNWNAFLAKAIAKPKSAPLLNSLKHNKIRQLSVSWTTCACGNQCSIIPRDIDGAPLDGALVKLGMQFYKHIRKLEWKKAKTVLAAIERRSAILIRRELVKGTVHAKCK